MAVAVGQQVCEVGVGRKFSDDKGLVWWWLGRLSGLMSECCCVGQVNSFSMSFLNCNIYLSTPNYRNVKQACLIFRCKPTFFLTWCRILFELKFEKKIVSYKKVKLYYNLTNFLLGASLHRLLVIVS